MSLGPAVLHAWKNEALCMQTRDVTFVHPNRPNALPQQLPREGHHTLVPHVSGLDRVAEATLHKRVEVALLG